MPVYRDGAGHVRGPCQAPHQLEPDGLTVAVQGARRDAYPSGMTRDMGGGIMVYVLCPGQRTRPDLVETFDDAPSDQIATVEEQRAFADAWREERKQR